MATYNKDSERKYKNPMAWLGDHLRRWGLEMFCKRYYGIYPGVVVDCSDPEGLGRIRATCLAIGLLYPEAVPDDYWMDPCMPGLGINSDTGQMSGVYYPPDVGTNVWIQFQHGDPDYPVYVGGFITKANVREELIQADALRKGIVTATGHFIRLSDDPVDLHITIAKGDGAGSQSPSFITMDKDGNVAISNDKGSMIYMNAVDDQVSVIVANENSETESLLMLGKDEVTMTTKGGASFGMKGKDITLNGGNLIFNGSVVSFETLQLKLGKGAASPAVKGDIFAAKYAAHMHPTPFMAPTSGPPLPPPPAPAVELSTVVMIA